MKKRKFKRWMSQSYRRVKENWRRPRGIHSKIREKRKGKIKIPSAGYKTPSNLRGLHPSGYREVLVYNSNDLQKIDSKKEAVKISRTVGKRKRQEILKKAEELKIKILNP